MNKRILKALLGAVSLVLLATGAARAATIDDLTLKVALDDTEYALDDPAFAVFAIVTLENEGNGELIAAAGLSDRIYLRDLVVERPDGVVLQANTLKDAQAAEPTMQPPVDVPPPTVCRDENNKTVQCEEVEILYGQDAVSPNEPYSIIYPAPDPGDPDLQSLGVDITANDEFIIDRTGYWLVYAKVPVRTYSAVYTERGTIPYARLEEQDFEGFRISNKVRFAVRGDYDGDGFEWYPVDEQNPEDPNNPVDCDDTNADVYPGATEDLTNNIDDNCDGIIGTVPPAALYDVEIRVDEHAVGSGNYPPVVTSQLAGIGVRAFNKADPCVQPYDASRWQHRRPLLLQCIPEAVVPTDNTGVATLQLEAGDWWFIAVYPPGSPLVGGAPGSPNDGSSPIYGVTGINVVDPAPAEGYSSLIKFTRNTSNGKTVPSSWKKRSGSVLLIVQPDYIEWDGETADYPFVFDTEGDWTVTTSVAPPEGFVADENALTADVNSEIEAVQFTITDVGSDWVSTGVEYEVKHKDKKEKIKSKIGVKLSKKLAKQKKLPWWGDEAIPPLKTVEKEAAKEDKKTTTEKKVK